MFNNMFIWWEYGPDEWPSTRPVRSQRLWENREDVSFNGYFQMDVQINNENCLNVFMTTAQWHIMSRWEPRSFLKKTWWTYQTVKRNYDYLWILKETEINAKESLVCLWCSCLQILQTLPHLTSLGDTSATDPCRLTDAPKTCLTRAP